MKKFILIFIFIFAFVGTFAFAGSEADAGNILPNSPFYFIKDLGREIQTFFTFDQTQKAELRLQIAEEKLAELEKLTNEDQNNVNYDKYLENYENALEKFQKQVQNVNKNDEKVDELLNQVANSTINQQEVLEKVKNRIENRVSVENIQNNAARILTESGITLEDPEKIKEMIQEKVQTQNQEEILNRVQQNAPENLKPLLQQIQTKLRQVDEKQEDTDSLGQVIQGIVQESQLIEKVNKDAAKLGLTPQEIQEKIENIPEQDKKIIKNYAIDIITGNKKPQEIVEDYEEMNLSDTTKATIDSLKIKAQQKIKNVQVQTQSITGMANPASSYCIKQGNKLEIRKDADGNEYGMCISPNGNECEEWKYYREECSF